MVFSLEQSEGVIATERVEAGRVGREAELAVLDEFIEQLGSARSLALIGEPGIGKTTIWEAGLTAARERGIRVLSNRASSAEAHFSFAGLIDLLDGIDIGELGGLPGPQRQALEVALVRADPAGAPPEARAIALGFLTVLRELAVEGPLLIAIDDVSSLDSSSSVALAFAARRLEESAVGFLVTRRPGVASEVERALLDLQALEVGPLSLGGLRRLLLQRLELSLPRHLLRRLVDATLGNPLFAIELGRTLVENELPGLGEELPVPDSVEALLGTRVARLPALVRQSLLAVALGPDLTLAQLTAIADATVVQEAVDGGLLDVEGERVRAAHPLLAAAARDRAHPRERRELHLALAAVTTDERLRARHLALATETTDRGLAAEVATAAAGATRRGAWWEAAELAEHALRLTPPAVPERADRVLELGDYLVLAGDEQRATQLLSAEMASLPRGSPRARAWMTLAQGVIAGNSDVRRFLRKALVESETDPGIRALALADLAENTAVICVERMDAADQQAREALKDAQRGTPDVERRALYALSWTRGLRGLPVDDLCEQYLAASDATIDVAVSPERVLGQRHVWRGEVDEARGVLAGLLTIADEQGEGYSYALQRLHTCELALRVGDWHEAERLLDEWAEPADRDLMVWPMYERCRALLAAGLGRPEEACRWADAAIARAQETEVRWDELEALRARGIAALLAHGPARAAESLRAVWEHTQREGIDEPGVFPVAPDLVEALVELGELGEARVVTSRLAEVAEAQEHPWALATARRSRALVALAESYDEGAAAMLAGAAGDYDRLGLRFDHARTLLAFGRVLRRSRKWAAARRTLEQAVAAFDAIGSPGWAAEARSELARVSSRRPRPQGALTPAEEQVAGLAADGLSNKEIARALFVTVKTVEVHLSHAYAKLGVRSRAQLARRLSPPS